MLLVVLVASAAAAPPALMPRRLDAGYAPLPALRPRRLDEGYPDFDDVALVLRPIVAKPPGHANEGPHIEDL